MNGVNSNRYKPVNYEEMKTKAQQMKFKANKALVKVSRIVMPFSLLKRIMTRRLDACVLLGALIIYKVIVDSCVRTDP